jgi:hypothetical protein
MQGESADLMTKSTREVFILSSPLGIGVCCVCITGEMIFKNGDWVGISMNYMSLRLLE